MDASEAEALVAGSHGDPFAVLGVQRAGRGFVARCFIPGAERADAFTLDGAHAGALARIHDAGLFEGKLRLKARAPLRYQARNAGGIHFLTADPDLLAFVREGAAQSILCVFNFAREDRRWPVPAGLSPGGPIFSSAGATIGEASIALPALGFALTLAE